MKPIKIKIILGFTIACFFSLSAQAQVPTDSISLGDILSQVTTSFPSIIKSEQDLNAANARIGLAKTGYNPDISINSSYSHIGPLSSMTLPGLGTFELYPANNYSASVDYRQTIYDFGKTATNVKYENQNKEMVNLAGEQVKQKLSLSVVNIYYYIVYLQEALKIKDEQLKTLNEHLHFVEKKKETGSATTYEILTTKVRISGIENQKTDLQNALKVQTCQMNSLLGQPEKNNLVVKKDLQAIQMISSTDSLLVEANMNRQEMKMVQQKANVLDLKYKTVNSQNKPIFSFFGSTGFKNGYIPDENQAKLNYVIGVGLKIPLYDASRTKFNQQQVHADMESNKADIELTRRNITNEVVESQTNIESTLQKIKQSELQLQQAQQAYALAEVSFKSGVITNLELLDSSTSLSESGLILLKAKIDYSLNVYKLKIALGERIY